MPATLMQEPSTPERLENELESITEITKDFLVQVKELKGILEELKQDVQKGLKTPQEAQDWEDQVKAEFEALAKKFSAFMGDFAVAFVEASKKTIHPDFEMEPAKKSKEESLQPYEMPPAFKRALETLDTYSATGNNPIPPFDREKYRGETSKRLSAILEGIRTATDLHKSGIAEAMAEEDGVQRERHLRLWEQWGSELRSKIGYLKSYTSDLPMSAREDFDKQFDEQWSIVRAERKLAKQIGPTTKIHSRRK